MSCDAVVRAVLSELVHQVAEDGGPALANAIWVESVVSQWFGGYHAMTPFPALEATKQLKAALEELKTAETLLSQPSFAQKFAAPGTAALALTELVHVGSTEACRVVSQLLKHIPGFAVQLDECDFYDPLLRMQMNEVKQVAANGVLKLLLFDDGKRNAGQLKRMAVAKEAVPWLANRIIKMKVDGVTTALFDEMDDASRMQVVRAAFAKITGISIISGKEDSCYDLLFRAAANSGDDAEMAFKLLRFILDSNSDNYNQVRLTQAANAKEAPRWLADKLVAGPIDVKKRIYDAMSDASKMQVVARVVENMTGVKPGDMANLYDTLLYTAANATDDVKRRVHVNNTLYFMICEVKGGRLSLSNVDRLQQAASAEEAPRWLAQTLANRKPGALAKAVHTAMPEEAKIRAFIHLLKLEDDPSWKWDWTDAGCAEMPTVRDRLSLDQLIKSNQSTVPSVVVALCSLYKEKVGSALTDAFKRSHSMAFMPNIVSVATFCGLHGSPLTVMQGLAPHMQREVACLRREHKRMVQQEASKKTVCELEKRVKHYEKACDTLLLPDKRVLKEFQEAMPASMLPESETTLQQTPPLATTYQTTALIPTSNGPAITGTPPPGQIAPAAPPQAMLPPAAPALSNYLRRHIHPRADCDKCAVARGDDPSVRSLFASEGGNARGRDVSKKRACPLADHAISTSDCVPLLDEYERSYGVKVTNKKQKICEFMQTEYGVERIGKAPSYRVSLYSAPRVGASLSLTGGAVKLDLQAHGYEPVTKKGTTDNYMGFFIA